MVQSYCDILVEKYKQNKCRTLIENIIYPLVGLDLLDIDDVDGYILEPSGNLGTLLNQLLVENTCKTSTILDLNTQTTHLLYST